MFKKYRLRACLLLLLALGPVSPHFVSWATAQLQKPPVQTGVEYGAVGDQKLLLDVYGADATQKRPAIVLLHGGAWRMGSRREMGGFAAMMAARGYVCFTVSYRLVAGDTNRYPAQIDDVQRAVRWIRAHADEYGVNPAKIGALGASAGGHLAALLGSTDTRDNSITELAPYSSRVQAVVDLYGPADFSTMAGPGGDPTATPIQLAIMQSFLGPLPENAANYREASPITHVDAKTAPFLIFHGGKDTLVPLSQSEQLDKALKKAKIESKLVVFPDAGHGYREPDLLSQTLNEAVEFFDRHLKP